MAPPILISAGNPGPLTGAGNNTWLIDGRVPTLIDAGVGDARHIEAIANALGSRPLARVLVTHGHGDHSSGAPALRARWPTVEIAKAHRSDEDVKEWRAIADGDRIAAGDTELVAIATPGHAIDHMCFWDETSGDLFGGDMVVHGTTVLIPGDRGGGLRAYLRSLEGLADLNPRRIFPGHGPIIDDPLEAIAAYMAHRREREEQILACLADHLTDPDAIVARVYAGLAPALLWAARQTVEAHLGKIRDERGTDY